MTPEQPSPPVKVSPRINLNLNSIYQTVMMIMAVIGILAGVLTTYQGLSSRLTDHEARITAIEHRLDDQRKADMDFQAEMRNGMASILATVSDLRVAMATKGLVK